jgi:ribonuclease G
LKKKSLLLISVRSFYIRVAHLKDGVLSDIYLENLSTPSQVGAIYKAQIVKKKVGLDACFVNMGSKKSAFLYTGKKDLEKSEEGHSISQISKKPLKKKSQTLMVQVVKDPLKGKNVRVSDKISLPGLYLVYLPNSPFHIGVSRRIEDEKTRERLTQYVQELGGNTGAVIVRTKAAKVGKEELERDLKKLQLVWEDIQEKYKKQKTPGLIWSDVSFSFQILRDLLTEEVDQVLIDDEKIFFRVQEYVSQEELQEKKKISFYKSNKLSLFDKYDLETELDQLLEKKVKLKSGGFIVIEETEAAVVIDVNTGSFMGKKTPEENILRINMEAAEEIAIQIRLRNCGGIILIDFIDMEEEQSRQQVMELLSSALKEDKSPVQLFPMSELGVVQLTRKRVRASLLNTLCEPCPHCKGRSYIKK